MLSLAVAALLTFHDVPSSSWAYPDVVLLASAGALHGEKSGAFNPTGDVSREQAAATLARVLALPSAPLGSFKDGGQVSPTLLANVASAVHAGILEGTAQGFLEPRAALDRAAAAALLARAFGIKAAQTEAPFTDAAAIPSYAQGDVSALAAAGIVEGTTGGAFDPLRPVTRAEWAALLLRAVIAHGGAAGVPSIAAGSVTQVFPPDNSALAASSSLGGSAGALEIGGRTLTAAQGALFYRQGEAADFYAVTAGDKVAAWIAPDGRVALSEDLRIPAAEPGTGVIADLSQGTIYLDTGSTFKGSPVSISYGATSLSLAQVPDYLLWAKAAVAQQGAGISVDVASPYVFDLQGTITSVSQTAISVRLANASALSPLVPSLGAGETVAVQISPQTQIAGVGVNAPETPAIGLSVQVMGYVQQGGAVSADHVTLSQ